MPGRTLQITYVGDSSRVLAAQKQIDTGHSRMQTGIQKTGKFFHDAFGITAPLATALAVGAVVKLGAVVVNAAADQNEALNVVNKTFGRTAETVTSFADDAALSFGISETAALQAAGGFGAMLKSAGITGQGLADMSTKVVGLAGDLASFKNVKPEEALEKLRSGLAGETEPLRTFGVFLSEARVQAEAFASGIAKQGEELTEAQKIQARYQLILQDTTDAHGDFAETLGESLPNQLRAARAELTNLAADIGQVLLPIVLNIVKVFRATLGPALAFVAENLHFVAVGFAAFAAFRWLPGLIDATAAAFIRLQAALGATLSTQVATSSFFAALRLGFTTTATAATGFAAALIGGTAALAAWDPLGFVDDQKQMNKRLEEGTLHLGKFTSQTVLGKGPLDVLGRAVEETGRPLEHMQATAGLAAQGILNLGGATVETTKRVKDAQERIKNFANFTDEELETWATDTKESFATFVGGLQDITSETRLTREDFRDAIRDMRERAQELSQTMHRLRGEKWVNDEFVTFLSDLGPEWLMTFSRLNDEQGKKFQNIWEQSNTKLTNTNERFDRMIGLLGDLGRGKTEHKIVITYEYRGFDPSKPGMTAPPTGVQR